MTIMFKNFLRKTGIIQILSVYLSIMFLSVLITIISPGEAVGEQTIVINEFMYDPPCILGDDDDYEWIELYNYGGEEIDLTGWFLNDVELTGKVQPYSFFIIARQDESDPDYDGNYFSAFYNEGNGYHINCPVFDAANADLGLDNMSGIIELLDAEHGSVDRVVYTRHESKGHTVEKVCPFIGSEEEHWHGCKEEKIFGTPDYQNTRLVVSSQLSMQVLDETGRKFQNDITIRNNTSIEDEISLWGLVLHIDSGQRHFFPLQQIHLSPGELVQISKTFIVPEYFPEGRYLFTLITGIDDNHSFAPENEEFSVTALTGPGF